MSARREHRLRKLEKRVEYLERIAASPTIIQSAAGVINADWSRAPDAPEPRKTIWQKILSIFK